MAASLLALPVHAGDLPSYEASYEIRLTHASASTGPRAAVGRLDTLFRQSCDGWDTKTWTVLDLAFRDGSNFTNERLFESWESTDGEKYRFTVQTFKNGQTVESYRGRAALDGRQGRVTYESIGDKGERIGDSYVLPLPLDTMLPVAHSKALLDRAAHGESLFRSVVLNGASSTGPRIMSVAIGPRLERDQVPVWPKEVGSEKAVRLLETPAWQISSALFNLHEKNRETPNSEMSLQLHQNGVTQFFEQTFEDFTLSAHMTYLRYLDPPQCD